MYHFDSSGSGYMIQSRKIQKRDNCVTLNLASIRIGLTLIALNPIRLVLHLVSYIANCVLYLGPVSRDIVPTKTLEYKKPQLLLLL